MTDLREDDDDLGRVPVGNIDQEMQRFFDGEDLSGSLVPDGGKGLIINDCEDCG